MTTQYGNGLVPPTTGLSGVSLIATCDPVLSGLTAAFAAILKTKLNAAWAAAAQGFASDGTTPVAVVSTFSLEPERAIAQRTWQWPALALWRGSEKWTQVTRAWDGCDAVINGAYILPPMTQEMHDRLGHIRVAVIRTLRAYIENCGDSSYTMPGVTPATTDFITTLGIDKLYLTDAVYGVYEASDTQLGHPAVTFKLELREREMPNTTGITDLSTVETQFDLVDGTTLDDVLDTSFDATP